MKNKLFVLVLLGASSYGQTGTFKATGNMITPRFDHTATLLPNGKVLIAGGYIMCSFPASGPCLGTNTAELYDPVTGTFSATGSMTMTNPTGGILLPDGRVFFVRGDGILPSVELYDPVTGNFNMVDITGILTGVYFASPLNDGRVLLTGRVGDSPPLGPPPGYGAEIYDPANGSFTAVSDWPQQIGWPVTVQADGRVLFYRVNTDLAPGGTALYDPATGTFSPTKGPDFYNLLPLATGLLNGKVLFAGGDTDNFGIVRSAALYDPATGTLAITGSMATARLYHTATLLPDNTVLVAGGGDQIIPAPPPFASAELYDPFTGKFSATEQMTTPRSSHTAVLLKSGQVLITGGSAVGSQSSISGVSSAELYTPAVLVPAPVLFSLSGDGKGQGAVWHAQTGQIASADNPAVAGEALSMYTTSLAEGAVIPLQVTIGGQLAQVLYFGDAPGYPGYYQVNVRVPSGVAPGTAVPVHLTYLGRPSNEVTIAVQ